MAKKKNGSESTSKAKELKIKKITITNRKEFIALKAFLVERNKEFMWTSQGSVNSIIYEGKEFVSVDLQESGGKGHHLNRRFKTDIDNWLSENGAELHAYGHDYKEQMFNLGAIEKNLGKLGVAIDLNDCYWKTSYKLRYITEQTYIIGLKKKEWKTGRNGCIGSLIKSQTLTPYVKGENGKSVPNYKAKPAPIKNPIEYMYIRNHIIGSIYQMFYRLYEEIGDKFLMFLTDCVFTDYTTKRIVENFFTQYGYKMKSKPIEFTGVDRGEKMIRWHDFEAPRKDKSGNVTGKGIDKYYYYSTAQIIDGTRSADVYPQTPLK